VDEPHLDQLRRKDCLALHKEINLMLQRFHDRVGTAGLIVAIVALVAAMSGGAYAANSALSGKQKKEVEKIAKKYAGKPGSPAAAGPSGPVGPAGPKGDTGAAGANGTPGKDGKEGPEGPEGLEGSPWTAGGTLPKGATETGAWSLSGASSSGEVYAPISFTIPLSAPLAAAHVHYIAPGGQIPNVCTGSATSPQAAEGELCVYQTEISGATPGGIFDLGNSNAGSSKAGAFAYFEGATAAANAIGSWAVTGG
jgi:hypothetical protein